jgi:hypothetical protein
MITRRSALCASSAALLATACPWPALAAPEVSRADAKAVRSVIEAQLAAFAADDAERAFGFAAPNIRATFGNADRFMAMVREGYPVVYRPASVAFLAPQPGNTEGLVLQQVRMTDADGAPWLVAYELERQSDQQWRITACVAVRAPGRTT